MQTTPVQVIQVKFSIRFYQNINVTVKVLHQLASYRNFRAELQYSDSGKCQREFWVILHFHHQQPAISPAKSAKSLKSQVLYTMSQSSCASSSVYSKSALSAISSFEDADLFMRNDSAGQQSTIPIIPKIQPELYEFEGSDFIAMEDSMRQQDNSGNLRPPTQQEVRRLRQERISWVQHVQ